MGMTTVQDNSVLYLNLTGSFEEKSTGDEALKMLFEKKQDVSSSLDAVLKALRIGKEQDKIKGLFIETKGNSAGIATLYEIRQAAPILIITQARGRCKPFQAIPDSAYKVPWHHRRRAPSW